jgi:hypothetical protein
MQATVRAAIEKGQPLPPELVEALSKDVRPKTVSSAHRDMRIGVILLAVAGGVALTGSLWVRSTTTPCSAPSAGRPFPA